MAALMVQHIALCMEAFLAILALERPISTVDAGMSREVLFLAKDFITARV